MITNTRETGKLEVKKSLSPTNDPGKFNLQIDGTTDPDAQNVGNGGSTNEQTINTGSHTVGETAGTGTSLGGLPEVDRLQGRQRHRRRRSRRPAATTAAR